MNAPIVHANPEPTSFCATPRDVGARALREAGRGAAPALERA